MLQKKLGQKGAKMMEYNEVQIAQFKSQIRVEEEQIKSVSKMQMHEQMLKQNALHREHEREIAKAQCEMVTIDENGTVRVETKNLRTPAVERFATNFTFPAIIFYQRVENPDEELYLFTCCFKDEMKSIFLLPQKCSSATYIINQIARIGGIFFAQKQSEAKSYAKQLITLLIRNCEDKLVVPDNRGWYIDESDELKFFSGVWTWKEAREKCVN